MSASNRALDLADRRAEEERVAGIARIQAAIRGQHSTSGQSPMICDCGEPIAAARRAAVPGTRLCIDCATFEERLRRRRA
ncbi:MULTISPECIES: TraR/DksA C4-type zinc finger protein [unclassified Mesorhizobium]|uniref:TraR/DksA C4-type zinc finger protein n=1 Tax=unclassified Mesorhizobium TaxID=325217 RepID=UPI0009EAF8D9|nr:MULTISPECIES: TraR/DksA C4-type zinc finger protein [unclassified Mesorhizobium]